MDQWKHWASKKHGYSLFNAFLKDSGKYIGYCGCKEIELEGQIENELSWDIYKKYKEDDIDIEIAFAVRNYLFKHFSIHSLISLVESTNSQDMNVAEAIDMENERTLQKGHDKWLIYVVNRKSPKFLASFGDGESPVRSASLNRNENLPRSMKDLKRPKPRPR